jgi:hypothetical protein
MVNQPIRRSGGQQSRCFRDLYEQKLLSRRTIGIRV